MWIWSQFQSKWVTKAIFGFYSFLLEFFFDKTTEQSELAEPNQAKAPCFSVLSATRSLFSVFS